MRDLRVAQHGDGIDRIAFLVTAALTATGGLPALTGPKPDWTG